WLRRPGWPPAGQGCGSSGLSWIRRSSDRHLRSSDRHLGERDQRQGSAELAGGGRLVALQPRIAIGVNRLLDAGIQLRGDAFGVVDDDRADLLDSDPRDERVGPLQPFRFLAVVLQEPARQRDDLLRAVDGGEQVALADMRAAGAADVDLPAAPVDPDDADVLDQAFGAVAGAAVDGELQLSGAFEALVPVLDRDAERCGVTDAEPAEILAHAGLHCAETLAVGVAARHVEVGPDLRQVLLAHA